jgi:activator of 2-hydroxyglutaryl-CoA dehydratase
MRKNFNGRPEIIGFSLHAHEGDPKKTLLKALEPLDLSQFDRIAATGRRFRHFVNLSSISEPEAVEYAYKYVKPEGVSCPAVISAGGETFMVYVLDKNGRIANVMTGNKCASGTGEFLLQQLRRMNVSWMKLSRGQPRKSLTMYPADVRCFVNPTAPMPPTKVCRKQK